MANPEKLHEAITQRFRETGHPCDLTLISSAGFGLLDADRGIDKKKDILEKLPFEVADETAGYFPQLKEPESF